MYPKLVKVAAKNAYLIGLDQRPKLEKLTLPPPPLLPMDVWVRELRALGVGPVRYRDGQTQANLWRRKGEKELRGGLA